MDAVVERDEVVQRVEDEDEFVRVFVMKKPLVVQQGEDKFVREFVVKKPFKVVQQIEDEDELVRKFVFNRY